MWNAQPIDVGLYGSAPRYGDLCVHAVIDLRRSFTREELERAFLAAVSSFPVLGCVYEPHFFRDRWVPARSPISAAVLIGTAGELEPRTEFWTHRSLDAESDRPLRLVLLPRPDGCRLIITISHLAVDGAGMAAVGHVLGSYLYGLTPALPIEPRRDIGRALNGLSLRHLPVLVRDTLSTIAQPFRVFAAAPRERPYSADTSAGALSRQLVLEAAELEAIRARCGSAVRVNDLLVAAIALVGARRSTSGPVSVLYTMDLRRFSAAPHLSATNASTILTTVIPRAAAVNLESAVKAVGEMTAQHRNSLVGPAFVLLPLMLAGAAPHGIVRRIVPGIHPVMVDLPLSRGLIFTNVGRVDAGLAPFADDIEDMRVVGPNIRGVPAPAVVAFGLRGRIHLELFAPPGLGEEALDELEAELREVFGLPTAR